MRVLIEIYLVHGRSPKVIHEDILQRRMLSQVAIILYRTYVIENKSAVEGIVVAQDANQCNDSSINV